MSAGPAVSGATDLVPQVGHARPLDEQAQLQVLASDLAWRDADIQIAVGVAERSTCMTVFRARPFSSP